MSQSGFITNFWTKEEGLRLTYFAEAAASLDLMASGSEDASGDFGLWDVRDGEGPGEILITDTRKDEDILHMV